MYTENTVYNTAIVCIRLIITYRMHAAVGCSIVKSKMLNCSRTLFDFVMSYRPIKL